MVRVSTPEPSPVFTRRYDMLLVPTPASIGRYLLEECTRTPAYGLFQGNTMIRNRAFSAASAPKTPHAIHTFFSFRTGGAQLRGGNLILVAGLEGACLVERLLGAGLVLAKVGERVGAGAGEERLLRGLDVLGLAEPRLEARLPAKDTSQSVSPWLGTINA